MFKTTKTTKEKQPPNQSLTTISTIPPLVEVSKTLVEEVAFHTGEQKQLHNLHQILVLAPLTGHLQEGVLHHPSLVVQEVPVEAVAGTCSANSTQKKVMNIHSCVTVPYKRITC